MRLVTLYRSCNRTLFGDAEVQEYKTILVWLLMSPHVMEDKLTCIGDMLHEHREVRHAGVLDIKQVSWSVFQS